MGLALQMLRNYVTHGLKDAAMLEFEDYFTPTVLKISTTEMTQKLQADSNFQTYFPNKTAASAGARTVAKSIHHIVDKSVTGKTSSWLGTKKNYVLLTRHSTLHAFVTKVQKSLDGQSSKAPGNSAFIALYTSPVSLPGSAQDSVRKRYTEMYGKVKLFGHIKSKDLTVSIVMGVDADQRILKDINKSKAVRQSISNFSNEFSSVLHESIDLATIGNTFSEAVAKKGIDSFPELVKLMGKLNRASETMEDETVTDLAVTLSTLNTKPFAKTFDVGLLAQKAEGHSLLAKSTKANPGAGPESAGKLKVFLNRMIQKHNMQMFTGGNTPAMHKSSKPVWTDNTLRYQTGRFGKSLELTSISENNAIGYSYFTGPYDTFHDGAATKRRAGIRSPRRIMSMAFEQLLSISSVRSEMAAEFTTTFANRFTKGDLRKKMKLRWSGTPRQAPRR